MNLGRIKQTTQKNSVSIFRNYRDSHPIGEVDLLEWLLSSTYKTQVEAIRNESDPDKRRLMKSALPCITPSGTFTKRKRECLKKPSGFICIDIDGKDNTGVFDWEAAKSTIAAKVAHLYYCGLSVSGNGLFCIVPIAEPERHKEYFDTLAEEFAEIGFVIDKSCKDVSRLRGASYDPRPVFNEYAKPCVIPEECRIAPAKSPIIREECRIIPQVCDNSDVTSYRVYKLVEMIERQKINIADNYLDWFAIGRAIASEFGEQGRRLFHAISSQSEKYDPSENDRQYNRCLQTCSRTSISTLFYLCRQIGLLAK